MTDDPGFFGGCCDQRTCVDASGDTCSLIWSIEDSGYDL